MISLISYPLSVLNTDISHTAEGHEGLISGLRADKGYAIKKRSYRIKFFQPEAVFEIGV